MVKKLKDLVVKPMVTGIAAGVFPTLVVLYGVNESINEVRVKEQLLKQQSEDHTALLKEKVELIKEMTKLQENYELLIEENARLRTEIQTAYGAALEDEETLAKDGERTTVKPSKGHIPSQSILHDEREPYARRSAG